MDKSNNKRRTYCCACGNSAATSYFRIPLKENVRRQWLQRCGLEGREVSASAKLCEDHFSPESYTDTKNKKCSRRRLKLAALPNAFVPVPISPEQRDEGYEDVPAQRGEGMQEKTTLRNCFICGSFNSESRPTFCFPKDACRRKEWFDIIGRPSMSSELRLCSRHFSDEDIIHFPCSGYHRLRRNAAPMMGEALDIVEVLINEPVSNECASFESSMENVTSVADIEEEILGSP